MTLAVCDWTGDDAWLWKFRCQHRRFNFNGDTTWVRGRVLGKDATDYGNEVRIEVSCENQHGAVLSICKTVVSAAHPRPAGDPSPSCCREFR